MMKIMFCPKCGADAQSAESYCKRCGEWLPDIDALVRPRLFRRWTREQKIRKMRVLEAVSAGLSLTSAAIILAVLSGNSDTHILFVSFLCCLLIAIYQMVNFYLGHKLQQKVDQSRAEGIEEIEAQAEKRVGVLGSAGATPFVGRHSVVEKTTELLEPVSREAKRDK